MSKNSEKNIPRKAKGKRPQYFEDPAVDKLHLMLMAVMEELSVTRDRMDTIERLIEDKGLFKRNSIDNFKPTPEAEIERTQQRLQYISRVMRSIILDQDDSSDSSSELEFNEVVDIVSK
ncbi:MAG: hypothetical protein CMM18_03695 [Rhodospirillaceae bacterium]|nr:hypothetical protein [Rhodospirillaceae bacterium]|tara:strand:- start:710 stop:1066 length:357 start_codon:yes stop_codon:yes gene_type:complete